MVDRIKSACSKWSHTKLSVTAKTVFINSSLLSIPNYHLSVSPIPDSVLNEISKIIQGFYWSKNSNRKGIHAVGWINLIESKP